MNTEILSDEELINFYDWSEDPSLRRLAQLASLYLDSVEDRNWEIENLELEREELERELECLKTKTVLELITELKDSINTLKLQLETTQKQLTLSRESEETAKNKLKMWNILSQPYPNHNDQKNRG